MVNTFSCDNASSGHLALALLQSSRPFLVVVVVVVVVVVAAAAAAAAVAGIGIGNDSASFQPFSIVLKIAPSI